MEKIKIAEVITRLDWGGSPDIVRIICSYLDPEIYDIKLITGPTQYPTQKTKEFINNFGKKIVVIPQLKRRINPLVDFLALMQLYFLFRREKFDIVQTHTAKAGVLGRLAANLSGVAVIVHMPHGHNFYGYFGKIFSKAVVLLERFLAHFTDMIICLTDLERKDFLRFGITKPEKLCLIYQGLELDRYRNINVDKAKIREVFNIKSDNNVVGFIGRLEPIKGVEYLIEAYREVLKENSQIIFLIVGEGSLRKKLEQKMIDLGLENNFVFTGWREDIPQMLSIIDLLVLPSLNEAVGMILIEAQAMGIPVIATKVGGIPEVVKDNVTGNLVPAKSPLDLANAINNLLADKEKRLHMSEAAKVWVGSKFKVEDMINRISELYKKLWETKKRCCVN